MSCVCLVVKLNLQQLIIRRHQLQLMS